ncbi:MAG TPA: hypothetical protein VMU94_10650 [Streptosporangiaceae bacterium]|nr:hypothetical protein [Streptosporangiaceae bacterium]
MESRRSVIGWSAGIAAAAGGLCALLGVGRLSPWHDAWFVALFILAGSALVLLTLAGLPDLAAWLGGPIAKAKRAASRAASAPAEAASDCWLYTADGVRAPTAMSAMTIILPGTDQMQPQEEQIPSLRLVVLVACSRLGHGTQTGDLRSSFLGFLQSEKLMKLIGALAVTGPAPSWVRYASSRAGEANAVLVAADGTKVASARLDVPDGSSRYGSDPDRAMLILHIGLIWPRKPEAWAERIEMALKLPEALGVFLSDEVSLTASGKPPLQLGVKLEGLNLTSLIDIAGLERMPGGTFKSQAIGYFIADAKGKIAPIAASRMMEHVMLYGLNVEYSSSLIGL